MSCVELWHKLTQVAQGNFLQKFLEKIGFKGCDIVSLDELANYVDENFEKISKIFIEYKEKVRFGGLMVLSLYLLLFVVFGLFLSSIFHSLGAEKTINTYIEIGGLGLLFLFLLNLYNKAFVMIERYCSFITIKFKDGKMKKFQVDDDFGDVYKKLRVLIGNKLVKYGVLPYPQIPLGYYKLCEKHKDYLKKYLIFATFEDYKNLNNMYDELMKCRKCKYYDIGRFPDFGKIILNLENIESHGQ